MGATISTTKEQGTDYTSGEVATAVLPRPLMDYQNTPSEDQRDST